MSLVQIAKLFVHTGVQLTLCICNECLHFPPNQKMYSLKFITEHANQTAFNSSNISIIQLLCYSYCIHISNLRWIPTYCLSVIFQLRATTLDDTM